MTWQLYKCDSFREYSKSFLVDSTVSNEVEELCTSTQGILNVEKHRGGVIPMVGFLLDCLPAIWKTGIWRENP